MEKEKKVSKGKKVFKIIRKVLLVILCLVFVAWVAGTIINHNISKKNLAKMEGYYGEYYETANGRINYSVFGDGEETMVILPGLGSNSPHFEFTELVDYLDGDYKVIVIDPLGYGLSDETTVDRTTDNICSEIHEVLAGIGEEKYYIVGHSISGLYALNYCNLYEDEVLGFVGIDASVPAQIEKGGLTLQYVFTKVMRVLMIDSGLIRVLNSGLATAPAETFDNPAMQGNPAVLFKYLEQEDKNVYLELIVSKNANNTVLNEMKFLKANCEQEIDYAFPESIPVLYVLAQDTIDRDSKWEEYHQDLMNSDKSKVVTMEGPHYLHIYDAKKLYNIITDWMED